MRSLLSKILLSLVISVVIALLVVVLITRISLQRGMVHYIEQQEVGQLEIRRQIIHSLRAESASP